ncbi:MAG: hypothetical protein AAF519_07235, partial [Bacteroidota bacterium]
GLRAAPRSIVFQGEGKADIPVLDRGQRHFNEWGAGEGGNRDLTEFTQRQRVGAGDSWFHAGFYRYTWRLGADKQGQRQTKMQDPYTQLE